MHVRIVLDTVSFIAIVAICWVIGIAYLIGISHEVKVRQPEYPKYNHEPDPEKDELVRASQLAENGETLLRAASSSTTSEEELLRSSERTCTNKSNS